MDSQPLTLAVVDDDADTVALLVDFFGLLGFAVAPCPVGPGTAACIRAAPPDLVILDVQLNGHNGVNVLREFRAAPDPLQVPVIFFTGSADRLRQLLPNYTAHGAYLVAKPKIEQLCVLVQRLVPRSVGSGCVVHCPARPAPIVSVPPARRAELGGHLLPGEGPECWRCIRRRVLAFR